MLFGLALSVSGAGVARAQSPAAPSITDVWIDTDPSIGLTFHDADDGFALVQAFHSPELRILGISVSYGNTTLAKALPITRTLATRFGPAAGVSGSSVFAGAASPADLGRPTDASRALETTLADFASRGQRLVYLALGPLTNLAGVLQSRPDLRSAVSRVIFLGGRAPGERFRVSGSWNRYEFHDANFEKDPVAAALVLDSGVPLTLVPVALAFREELLITPADFERLQRDGTPAGLFLSDAASGWLRGWRFGFGARGGPIFDSLAVLAAAQPELCTFSPRRAVVSKEIDRPVAVVPRAGAAERFFLLILPAPDTSSPADGGQPPTGTGVLVCEAVASPAKAAMVERLQRRAPEPAAVNTPTAPAR